jgi:hypothetical protein
VQERRFPDAVEVASARHAGPVWIGDWINLAAAQGFEENFAAIGQLWSHFHRALHFGFGDADQDGEMDVAGITVEFRRR